MSRWLRWRSSLDRGIAVVLASLLWPVVAFFAYVVRRHDGGPAVIPLVRVGYQSTTFSMWKLRTMRSSQASGRSDGPPITCRDDDRVTSVGARLRRLRLDELPQLLNIIRGEMTIIGPRPETPEYVDAADPTWSVVLLARPGIAGPAQVLLHDWEEEVLASPDTGELYSQVILPVKLAIDRWYVQRSTPWVDCLVVVSLAQRFLGRCDVTVLHRRLSRDLPTVMSSLHAGVVSAAGASAAGGQHSS